MRFYFSQSSDSNISYTHTSSCMYMHDSRRESLLLNHIFIFVFIGKLLTHTLPKASGNIGRRKYALTSVGFREANHIHRYYILFIYIFSCINCSFEETL